MSSIDSLFNVKGQVAVITGGGTGIGYMIAEGLALNGMKVYIVGRRQSVIEQAAAKLNKTRSGSAVVVIADVTSKEDVSKLVKLIEEQEDCVDLLVNNAGICNVEPASNHLMPLEDLQSALLGVNESEWTSQFSVNAWSPYIVTASLLHLLANAAKKGDGRGSVVMISSICSKLWNPYWHVKGYSVTKAAVEHLTMLLAAKLYPLGIRVNTIAPGAYPSEANQADSLHSTANPAFAQTVPLRRIGSPDDLAGTVIFLASRAGSYITGQRLDVDGGLMLIGNGANKWTP